MTTGINNQYLFIELLIIRFLDLMILHTLMSPSPWKAHWKSAPGHLSNKQQKIIIDRQRKRIEPAAISSLPSSLSQDNYPLIPTNATTTKLATAYFLTNPTHAIFWKMAAVLTYKKMKAVSTWRFAGAKFFWARRHNVANPIAPEIRMRFPRGLHSRLGRPLCISFEPESITTELWIILAYNSSLRP